MVIRKSVVNHEDPLNPTRSYEPLPGVTRKVLPTAPASGELPPIAMYVPGYLNCKLSWVQCAKCHRHRVVSARCARKHRHDPNFSCSNLRGCSCAYVSDDRVYLAIGENRPVKRAPGDPGRLLWRRCVGPWNLHDELLGQLPPPLLPVGKELQVDAVKGFISLKNKSPASGEDGGEPPPLLLNHPAIWCC